MPSNSQGWMDLHEKLTKDKEEAIKLKLEIEERYNSIKRSLIDLSAQKTDLIRQKHDLEVVLNKARENIRRIGVEQGHAKDMYFSLSKVGE